MQFEESPADQRTSRMSGASVVAGVAFGYALIATLVLVFLNSFFADAGNQRTVLSWMTLPIAASFFGWLAVASPNSYLRIIVWLLVLAVLFFCWLAIFSIGVYYLPVPFLMIMSVLGPWDDHAEHEDKQPAASRQGVGKIEGGP